MGSSKKGGSPPAPDYAAAAAAQGAASQQAAQYNTNANRVNQVGPQGSVTWSLRPGADPSNPQAGDYTQTTSYSPDQQRLYDSQNRISQQYANTAEGQLGRVQDAYSKEFNPTGLPALSGAPTNQSLSATPGVRYNDVNAQGLPNLAGSGGYAAERKAVEDAYMSRLQPQLDQNKAASENKLLNSGLERGSEAWNREMDTLNRQEVDARNQAVMAGGQEQSRLAGLDMAGRNQLYNEQLSNATFGNQAQGQNFAQQSQYDQMYNQLQERNANLNNAARSQGFQEQSYQRSLPLNEANALRTGAQVQNPTFSSYYTGGQMQAAPTFDATVAAGNYNAQAGANRQSGNNALFGGLAQLGSAYMGK